jgi:predicted ester cyclase
MSRMTMVSIIVALFVIVAGCGDSKDAGTRPQKRQVIETKAKFSDPVRSFIAGMEAYNAQDLAELVPLFPADVEWINMTALKPVLKGRPALARQLMQERNAFPDCKIGLNRILQAGDTLVVQGVFQGTHKGPIHSLAPTGKTVTYNLIYFIDSKEGMVLKNVAYFNPVTPMRQIGAIRVNNAASPEWSNSPEVVRAPQQPGIGEKVKQFYAKWQAGDWEQLDQMLTPDFSLRDKATVESITGRDEVRAYMVKELKDYRRLNFQIEQIETIGQYVALRVVKYGTYETKPKTEKEKPVIKDVEITSAHVFEFKDDKIASLDVYYDEFQLFKQFGIPLKNTMRFLSDDPPKASDAGVAEPGNEDAMSKLDPEMPPADAPAAPAKENPPEPSTDTDSSIPSIKK